jgi:hypothetical protein
MATITQIIAKLPPKCSICKLPGHNRLKCSQSPPAEPVTNITALTQQVSNLVLNEIQPTVQQPSTATTDITTIFGCLIDIICVEKEKEQKKDIWANSPFKDLVKLQSNNAGIVGERFIKAICDKTGIESMINGTQTKQKGGGGKDGVILGRNVEIKMAHQGCTGSSFQHELGEVPWKPQIMIFIDVVPQSVYITAFPNFTEEHYKSGNKCGPLFPTKQVTWRKLKGAFKFDTSIQINETNVTTGHAIKINAIDSFDSAGVYIRRIIESVPAPTRLPEPVVVPQ